MVLQVRLGMPQKKFLKKAEKEKRIEHQKLNTPAPSQLQSLSMDPDSSVPHICPLQQISSTLAFPSSEWSNQSPADLCKLQICMIPQVCGSSSQPLRIALNMTVNADL